MKALLIVSYFLLSCFYSVSQTTREWVDTVLAKVYADNDAVVTSEFVKGYGKIMTQGGLHYFFANKVGSYLSDGGDLSLFNNYATISTADGKFSLNKNFGKPEKSGRVKNLWTIGLKANVKDAFATVFNGKKFSNEIGLLFKYTYIGSGTMYFDGIRQEEHARDAPLPQPQKDKMNTIRALLISNYKLALLKKIRELKKSIDSLKADYVTDTSPNLKDSLFKEGIQAFKKEYEEAFSKDQATKITEAKTFNAIKTNWTSVSLYVPLTPQEYYVSETFLSNFSDRRTYPLDLNISKNWIFEWNRSGRLFVSLIGQLAVNNAAKADQLTKVTLDDYKRLGGDDTLKLGKLKTADGYIGEFSSFLTPAAKFQVVYFFSNALPFGVSFYGEQNFGVYNPLNFRFGVPFRINDKSGKPTVNFEIQVRWMDVTGSLDPLKNFNEKISVGFSIGVPFNSIL